MHPMKRPILVADDRPHDVEFSLLALEICNLLNEVVVTHDGAEALDYLLMRNCYSDRLPGSPALPCSCST